MKNWLLSRLARIRHFRDDQDLKDELRIHTEMAAEDHQASGLPPGEAMRRAHLQVGKPQMLIEKIRDQEFITIVEGWYRDFRLGLRSLRKNPVFCLTAVLTLALGIGANTAIFTLLHGLVLRSMPVPDPHRLVRVGIMSAAVQAANRFPVMPYRMLQVFRAEQRSFTGISAWLVSGISMSDQDGSLRLYNANLVSGNAFEVLGLNPFLGRLLEPADDSRGVPATGWPVVLGYGFWQDRFGGAPDIVGKSVKVSGALATVVGVAPPGFNGPTAGSDCKFYLPVQFVNVLPGRDDLESPNSMISVWAVGRLKPGVSLEQASAEVGVHQAELLKLIPPKLQSLPFYQKATFHVDSARTGLPSFFGRTYSQPLFLMQGLVAVVLLLCCVNVGGLMMSQVYARRREFAVRTAIGAARWRLIRQYLTESLVLAAAGAALGGAVALAGNNYLLHFFRHPMIGEWMSVHPDKTVLLVTALCALLTTVFFGLLPALQAGRTDPGVLLKSRTAGAQKTSAGRAFVPVQVALSLALVTLATLLSQSLIRLRGEDTGFDVKHVTIQTAPFHTLPQKDDAKLDLYQRMVNRIGQMPGVESVAVTWHTPMTGIQPIGGFQALTGGPNPPEDSHMPYNDVGPGYFRTMKTAIVEGREFTPNERERTVCILNRSAANFLFPHQLAIGGYVRSTDTTQFPTQATCRVIGLAEDAKFANLNEPPPRTIYFPLTKVSLQKAGNLVFLINSPTKAQSIAAYRKALAEIAPTVPLVLFVTLAEQMDAALGSQTMITVMSDFFAGLALLLSALGLYGLLASSVTQRTAEIGVRIALGAPRSKVLRMILADALRLVGTGIVAGGAVLYLGVRLVRDMLYGVSAFDAATWAGTAAVLVIVAMIAALAPALRAASVDPAMVLRAE
jgi:predicted permease